MKLATVIRGGRLGVGLAWDRREQSRELAFSRPLFKSSGLSELLLVSVIMQTLRMWWLNGSFVSGRLLLPCHMAVPWNTGVEESCSFLILKSKVENTARLSCGYSCICSSLGNQYVVLQVSSCIGLYLACWHSAKGWFFFFSPCCNPFWPQSPKHLFILRMSVPLNLLRSASVSGTCPQKEACKHTGKCCCVGVPAVVSQMCYQHPSTNPHEKELQTCQHGAWKQFFHLVLLKHFDDG